MSNNNDTARRPAGVEFSGYYAALIVAAKCRNELDIVMKSLRDAGQYRHSDALRDILDRLDAGVSYPEPELRRGVFQDITGDFQVKHCGGAPNMLMPRTDDRK